MVTLSERQKDVQNVNISRRKIKKYVEKLRPANTEILCPSFRTFYPRIFAEKRHILYNRIECLYFL